MTVKAESRNENKASVARKIHSGVGHDEDVFRKMCVFRIPEEVGSKTAMVAVIFVAGKAM